MRNPIVSRRSKTRNLLPKNKAELLKGELLAKGIDIHDQAYILNEGEDVVLFYKFL